MKILVFNKATKRFTLFRDLKVASEYLGVGVDVVRRSLADTHETNEFIVGEYDVVKSTRGGDRGGLNKKKG